MQKAKWNHDRKIKKFNYKIGDLVLADHPKVKKSSSQRIARKYYVPFEIVGGNPNGGRKRLKPDFAPQKDEEDKPETSNMLKYETSPQTNPENKLKFKRELDRHLKQNQCTGFKRNRLSCSLEEAEHHLKKFKDDEQTNDEDTNISFKSVIFVKDDQNEQLVKLLVNNQISKPLTT
ncbi:unnamed protein product [Brachionus calyciflorus]|uniref:Uncharacterized protein n=1 Tax=Brachionus calyciflorus TaxID=104777 RepID=A0A814HHP5_9BILA|nr:unnamed protein product [Brachionus calyciflorus]